MTALSWLGDGKTLKKPTAKKKPVAKPPTEPVGEYKPRAEPGRPACPPKYHLVWERRAMQEWIRDNTLLAQWRHEQKETCQIPTSGAAMMKRSENDMAAAEGDRRGKQYAKEYGHAKRRLPEAREEWLHANGCRVAVPTAISPRDPQKKERPWYPLKLLTERLWLEVPDAKYWQSKGGHDDSAQGGDNSSYDGKKGGYDYSTGGRDSSYDGNKGGHDYSKGGHDGNKGGYGKGGYRAGGYHGSKDGYDGTQV